MPTNFERSVRIIKMLIPIARRAIRDPELTVDAMVKRRLNQLSQAYGYRLLAEDREPIDYSMTTTHIAYCYRSLSAHADWLCQALSRATQASRAAVVKGRTVKVVSIGGGPGSDILGLLKFAIKEGIANRRFRFDVLDREPNWARTRTLLLETFDGEVVVEERDHRLDVSQDGVWSGDWRIPEADIITLSFFLSEVWSLNGDGRVSRFLQRAIDEAPEGALFVYVDNGGDNFTPLAEAEFDRDDIELVMRHDAERLVIAGDEQCNVLGEFRERFGQMPKLQGNIAMRIWKKRNA